MPFETLVRGVEQVAVFDAADAGIRGDAGHGREAVGDVQGRGVDVEVDVAVFHQQARAERPHEVRFGARRPPGGFQPDVADDLAGALLVGGRDFEDVFHDAFFTGLS